MPRNRLLIYLFLAFFLLFLLPVQITESAYLGPDRQKQVCTNELDCCHYSYRNTDPTCSAYGYSGSPCTCTINCVNCITGSNSCLNSVPVLQVQAHCGGTGWSQTNNWQSYKQTCNNQNLPEATISAQFHCETTGNDGWCRENATLQLTAEEPLSGEVITYLEGSNNQILCDPVDADSVSCTYAMEEGQGELLAWAVSSYGDTSRQTSVTYKVDTVLPEHNIILPIPTGDNGWYQNPITIEANFATDATSGLAYQELQLGIAARTSSPITINNDGIYTLHFFSEDLAGNNRPESREIRLDQTPPVIATEIPLPNGENNWYDEPVEFSFTSTDGTSGISRSWLSFDGTPLEQTATTPNTDGIHTLQFYTEDLAGNQTNSEVFTIQSDFTPPTLLVNTSPDTNKLVHGSVTFSGNCSDLTSGITNLTYQIDNGKLIDIDIDQNGSWQFQWNTLNQDGGKHNLTILANDMAGNLTSWSESYQVSNKHPMVSLTEQWYIWETGTLFIQEGDLPIQSVKVVISSDQYGENTWHYPIAGIQWTDHINWDRKINGIVMPPGEYAVHVTVTDSGNQQSNANGIILIPQPPTPTPEMPPTATATKVATTTPLPVSTQIMPTSTSEYIVDVSTSAITPVTTSLPPVESLSEESLDETNSKNPLWLISASGLFLVFALTQSFDPRPSALHNLQQFFENHNKRGNDE